MQARKTEAPAPDFDHSLEALVTCHERIEAQCETLKRLAVHLPQHGSDEQARQAAAAVIHYFDTAGQRHQDDEERDLFPRMVAAARSQTRLISRRRGSSRTRCRTRLS